MPALALNGLTIPTLYASATPKPDLLVDEVQSVGGAVIVSQRGSKERLSATTAPLTPSAAADVMGLLTRKAEHWDFDDATYWQYSEAGTGASGGSGSRATAAPAAKYGAARLNVPLGTYWEANTQIAGAWMVMVWIYEGGAWHHYASASDSTKYKDGAVYGSSIPFITVSGGQVRIGDAAAVAAQAFDDLYVLRWVGSASLVAAVYAMGVAVRGPNPYVTGDLVAGWTATTAVCRGIPDVEYAPHVATTFENLGQVIQFEISEP
tara:strand:- start:72 stop:863 length:792 start_codon:yes stop_codon:yes gene_type:complete